MQRMPRFLKPGDTIAIVAPAKAIEVHFIEHAIKVLEFQGFKVVVGTHCTGRYHYFSGTDAERLQDFQWAINHEEVAAILCARGGYGTTRILDSIEWGGFLQHPKWIIGFSDITALHLKLNVLGYASIHGTMPLNFNENSTEALATLFKALNGNPYTITAPKHAQNISGTVSAEVIGGNLSLVYSLLGTPNLPDMTGKILFLEEVGEFAYAVDRMFYALRQSGIFDKIGGLILGGMTHIKDPEPGMGQSIEMLLLEHFMFRSIPIAFSFPAGHIDDNRALIFGSNATLTVNSFGSTLEFLP